MAENRQSATSIKTHVACCEGCGISTEGTSSFSASYQSLCFSCYSKIMQITVKKKDAGKSHSAMAIRGAFEQILKAPVFKDSSKLADIVPADLHLEIGRELAEHVDPEPIKKALERELERAGIKLDRAGNSSIVVVFSGGDIVGGLLGTKNISFHAQLVVREYVFQHRPANRQPFRKILADIWSIRSSGICQIHACQKTLESAALDSIRFFSSAHHKHNNVIIS